MTQIHDFLIIIDSPSNFTIPGVYLGIWSVGAQVDETFLKTDQFSKVKRKRKNFRKNHRID